MEMLRLSITKLCRAMGIGHLADEVFSEVMLLICEKNRQYDPERGTFVTWALWQAKGVANKMVAPTRHRRYGGTQDNNVSMEYEYMFAEIVPLPVSDEGDLTYPMENEYLATEGMLLPPTMQTEFSDPFVDPWEKARAFVSSLTERELIVLKMLVEDGSVPYRKLGRMLGVSHTQAGKLLPSIMEGLRQKSGSLH